MNTRAILNDPQLLQAKEAGFTKLQTLFEGKYLEYVPVLDGIYGYSTTDAYKEPRKWLTEALDYLATKADNIMDSEVFRPLCLEFGPYGVHFIDKIFGAEVFFKEKQWYSKHLDKPVGSLTHPDIKNDETWALAKELAKGFIELAGELPIFGMPTIASALNIAVNLYGEEILVALCLEPEAAVHDLKVINELLCELHGWYFANIPLKQLQPVVAGHRTQPYGFGQICGCTTQLISPQRYKEFVAPLDEQLLSVYPNGGMIHLCGSHTQHISEWREMKSLRAVQINDRAAVDLEIYYRCLREDQIVYLNPCEDMTIEKAFEITGGNRLVIAGDSKVRIKRKI